MIHRITQVDEKNLKPLDKNICAGWETFPEADLSKPEIGRVQITNLITGEITKVNNLVLLLGREVLLQKLLNIGSNVNYNIRYFRVGDGGCTVGTTPSKIGPYDDDVDLKHPINFNTGNDSSNGTYKYIHNGLSKLIKADNGNIEIISERHEINTIDNDGNEVIKEIMSNTTVKFTMYVLPTECYSKDADGQDYQSRVFRFNEASLLLVDTFKNELGNEIPAGNDDISRFNVSYKTFARFTTLNKYLEAQDGLKIEWFILV